MKLRDDTRESFPVTIPKMDLAMAIINMDFGDKKGRDVVAQIKLVRLVTGYSLTDSKEFVEAVKASAKALVKAGRDDQDGN